MLDGFGEQTQSFRFVSSAEDQTYFEEQIKRSEKIPLAAASMKLVCVAWIILEYARRRLGERNDSNMIPSTRNVYNTEKFDDTKHRLLGAFSCYCAVLCFPKAAAAVAVAIAASFAVPLALLQPN